VRIVSGSDLVQTVEVQTEEASLTSPVVRINVDDVRDAAVDALQVTVGLGLLAYQRAAPYLRNLLEGSAPSNTARTAAGPSLVETLRAQLTTMEERLQDVEARLDEVLDQLEARLPTQWREASQTARDATRATRDQLLALLRGTG